LRRDVCVHYWDAGRRALVRAESDEFGRSLPRMEDLLQILLKRVGPRAFQSKD
jgi:hypothetical protein